MTIQQIQTVINGTNSQFNALPASARGMLIVTISGFKTLVNASSGASTGEDAKYLLNNTPNPSASGLTDGDYSTFISNILALFPS